MEELVWLTDSVCVPVGLRVTRADPVCVCVGVFVETAV
jgi:hypothetical protein